MKISVLMTVFNAERYVEAAVDSILRQTYTDFELIIVDDGSTDRSKSILQRKAESDSRIRLISRPNTGNAIAAMEGASLARGELLARMDADDVSTPDRFAKQVALLERDPRIVACGARILATDPEGASVREVFKLVSHEEIDAFQLRWMTSAIANPCAMIRRSAFDAVNGYRVELEPAEDFDLWLRLAEIGRLANVPSVLLRYRLHEKNISRTRARAQKDKSWLAVAHACQRRGLPPPPASPAPMMPTENLRYLWVMDAIRDGSNADAWRLAAKGVRRNPTSYWSWRAVARVALDPIYRPIRPLLRQM